MEKLEMKKHKTIILKMSLNILKKKKSKIVKKNLKFEIIFIIKKRGVFDINCYNYFIGEKFIKVELI